MSDGRTDIPDHTHCPYCYALGFVAGRRAGLLEAAQVCDERAKEWRSSKVRVGVYAMVVEAEACRDAIRALAAELDAQP